MNYLRYLILLLITPPVFAQQATTTAPGPELANAINSFYDFTGLQPALYNGPQHYGYAPSINGFAYFPIKEWSTGTVVYDKLTYRDVSVMYDAFSDNLVVKHMYGISFTPFRDRIDQFTLGDQVFVRLEKTDSSVMEPGFYQQMVTGKMDMLVRRKKTIREEIVNDVVEREFIPRDKYYLRKGNEYTPIHNSTSLVDAMGDRKKDVREFLRRTTVRYRKEPERYIMEAVQYYNQLSQ